MALTYNYTKKTGETRTIVTDGSKQLFTPKSVCSSCPPSTHTHYMVYDTENKGWRTLIKANVNSQKHDWASPVQPESKKWIETKKLMNEYCIRTLSDWAEEKGGGGVKRNNNPSPRILRCRVCSCELGTNVECDYCEHKRDEAQYGLL